VVLQVVLTEKLLGTGSGTASLTNLQAEINKQVAKGYILHTISTTSSGSKGFLGEIRSRPQWYLRGSTDTRGYKPAQQNPGRTLWVLFSICYIAMLTSYRTHLMFF
jgi:hypothetical protein